jgi:DNA processing protein
LRDGATLVEEAADVIASLAGRSGFGEEREAADFAGSATPQPNDGELVRARNIVTELLSMSPVAVDELIRQCQFSPAVVMAVLLELELAGRLERHPGNRVSLVLLP